MVSSSSCFSWSSMIEAGSEFGVAIGSFKDGLKRDSIGFFEFPDLVVDMAVAITFRTNGTKDFFARELGSITRFIHIKIRDDCLALLWNYSHLKTELWRTWH